MTKFSTTWIFPGSYEHKMLQAFAKVQDVHARHIMELMGLDDGRQYDAIWKKLNGSIGSYNFFANCHQLFVKVTRDGLYRCNGFSIKGVWVLKMLDLGFATDMETGNFAEAEYGYASIVGAMETTRAKAKKLAQIEAFMAGPVVSYDVRGRDCTLVLNELLLNRFVDSRVTHVSREYTTYEYTLNDAGKKFCEYYCSLIGKWRNW